MNSKEKIYQILNAIDEASQLTPDGQFIRVDVRDKQNSIFLTLRPREVYNILEMLSGKGVIKTHKQADISMAIFLIFTKDTSYDIKNPDRFCYLFEKDINFDKYFKRPEQYLDLKQSNLNENDAIYELSYTGSFSRHILIIDHLNKKTYLLKTPHYNSENRVIFEYLYNHLPPDSEVKIDLKILKEVVRKELNKELVISLHRVAYELGFTEQLKKLFFMTTENSAILRKKVTLKQLKESKTDISEILSNFPQV